jgi:hypothetical protein
MKFGFSMFTLALPFAQGDDMDDNWIVSGVYFNRTLTAEELKYTIKIGMSNDSSCDNIRPDSYPNTTELTLVVANTTFDVCQGWIHYMTEYPDKSKPHPDSAAQIRCVDGGITYAQSLSGDCSNPVLQPTPMEKQEYTTGCHRGWPPTVFTVLTDFSGCEAQGYKRSADGNAYFFPSGVVV